MSSADFHTKSSHSDSATGEKAKWSLTKDSFDKLLNSFSPDRDEAGVEYERTRRKLVRYFEWRAIESADDYADETINRVARRIDEGQAIENLLSYFYGVARMVFMEALKNRDREPISLPDPPVGPPSIAPEPPEPEPRVLCLDECLESLPADNRKLIIDYYQEERRAKIELRQEMADRLAIPLNALRIRAHRIRNTLEQCINRCVEASERAK